MEGTTVSRIHVGCSGWVYKHWRRIFYPEGLPQKRWFERYAEEFDTVEINASFYRLPLASTFEGWRNKAPPGFHYAVKVNRFITHMKKLLDCQAEVDRFIELARPLGDKLGPLLYSCRRACIRTSSGWRPFSAGFRRTSSRSSSSATRAGMTKTSWRCSTATVSASSPTISKVCGRRDGPAGELPTSASTVRPASIGVAIRTRRWSDGPTGVSSRRGPDEACGAISTTTSTGTRSTTRER